jgi:hypothetical protein
LDETKLKELGLDSLSEEDKANLEGLNDSQLKLIAKEHSLKKQAFKERDERKTAEQTAAAKLKEIEDARKADELEKALKNGEAEKLVGTLTTEKEALTNQVKELAGYKEKLNAVEAERKDELLEKLEDVHKEFAKDLPLEQLTKYVKLNGKGVEGKPFNPNRGGKMKFDYQNMKFDQFTTEQLVDLEKNDNPFYLKILKEKYPNRR